MAQSSVLPQKAHTEAKVKSALHDAASRLLYRDRRKKKERLYIHTESSFTHTYTGGVESVPVYYPRTANKHHAAGASYS